MSTETAPKTHRARAEAAARIIGRIGSGVVDYENFGFAYDGATTIIAQETFPTELVEAARRLAVFADAWDARPLRGVDNTMYTIHAGTEWEASIRLSDLRALRAALALYEDKP